MLDWNDPYLFLGFVFFAIPFLVSIGLSELKLSEYLTYFLSAILVVLSPFALEYFELLPAKGMKLSINLIFLIPVLVVIQYCANLLFYEVKEPKKK